MEQKHIDTIYELNECPFCGEDDLEVCETGVTGVGYESVFFVTCPACASDGPPGITEEDAAGRWNKRQEEQQQTKPLNKERKYMGADWVRSNFKITDMSPLGEKVANLLGDVYFGIYHLDNDIIQAVDWRNNHHVVVNLRHPQLATVDSSTLTRLVVLCHDRMLRMDLSPRSRVSVELMFHARSTRDHKDGIGSWCPTIEDHAAMIRGSK